MGTVENKPDVLKHTEKLKKERELQIEHLKPFLSVKINEEEVVQLSRPQLINKFIEHLKKNDTSGAIKMFNDILMVVKDLQTQCGAYNNLIL